VRSVRFAPTKGCIKNAAMTKKHDTRPLLARHAVRVNGTVRGRTVMTRAIETNDDEPQPPPPRIDPGEYGGLTPKLASLASRVDGVVRGRSVHTAQPSETADDPLPASWERPV
jgi:hypothetical protein